MISAVVLTKNDEKNIAKCLESVKWCDELIIIDDESSDKTIEIAREYNAKIYVNSLKNNFSAQRNFGLSKAKNEWVLFVDSDEIVSDALAFEISNAIERKGEKLRDFSGFRVNRFDYLWGKQLRYGEAGNIKLLRLGRKNAGSWRGMAHEVWKMEGLIGDLMNPIIHYPHQTLEEFLREVNFYSDIRAAELKEKNKKVSFWSIFAYPSGKFTVNYFFKRGFIDGIQGFIFAIIMSFHSFLVRVKLWNLQNKNN